MEIQSTSSLTLNDDLRAIAAGLVTVNPWVGLWRFVLIGVLFFSLVILSWSAPNLLLFASYTRRF
jgi:hypothetical protein